MDKLPLWAQRLPSKIAKGADIGNEPKLGSLPPSGDAVGVAAVKSQTAATSHNVFRDEIYRTTDGYLN